MLASLTDPLALAAPSTVKAARASHTHELELQNIYSGNPINGMLSEVHQIVGKRCVFNKSLQTPIAVVSDKYSLVEPSQFWDVIEQTARHFPGSMIVSAGSDEIGSRCTASLALRRIGIGKTEEAEARLTFLNSCDGSACLKAYPSLHLGHTEIVYVSEDKSEVMAMKHSLPDVVDKAKATASKMADSIVVRAAKLGELEHRMLSSLHEFSLFLRNAVYNASTDEVISDTGNGRGFLDREETFYAMCEARAQEKGCNPCMLLNAFISASTMMDWDPFKARGRSEHAAHWIRISGQPYADKARLTAMTLANAHKLAAVSS